MAAAARRAEQVHLDGGVEGGVEGDGGGGVHDHVARGEKASSVVIEVEAVAPHVPAHRHEPGRHFVVETVAELGA